MTKLILYPACKEGEYVVPDSVTTIENHAFSGCSGLTSITIPDSVTEIGSGAFYGCSGLKEIIVGENNENYISVDDVLFNKDMTKLILYPACKEGEYVIPDSVTEEIGYGVFSGCTGLTSVTIPDSVTTIGNSAFSGCTGLTSVTIPDSVTTIGHLAFYKCTGLTSITIPDSVTTIEWGLFFGCTGLTSVTIGGGVTKIDDSAFEGCSGLKEINVNENNEIYKSVDGVLFNKDMTVLLTCPSGKEGSYIIPDSVVVIMFDAFDGCTVLESVTIGKGVKYTSVYDESESEYYYDFYTKYNVFKSCTSLKEITVDEENEYYKSVDGVLFNKNMRSLITYPVGKEGAYVVPDSVIQIEMCAFYGCTGLTSIEITKNVYHILPGAFIGCKNLKNVVINKCEVVLDDEGDIVDELAFYIVINSNAFSGCENLEEIKICRFVVEFGDDVFDFDDAESVDFTIYGYVNSIEADYSVKEYASKHSLNFVELQCEHENMVTDEQEPTCTEWGIKGRKACYECGFYDEGEQIPPLGHSIENYVSNNDATCTKDGTKTAKCERCGETQIITDVGSAKGHTAVKDGAVEPTCTKTGLTEGSHCSKCGATVEKQEIIPALGHVDSDNDGICDVCARSTSSNDDCDTAGHIDSDKDGICDSCGDTMPEVKNCKCICHKSGFAGFIYKIIRFLWKIFRMNKSCDCGLAHY